MELNRSPLLRWIQSVCSKRFFEFSVPSIRYTLSRNHINVYIYIKKKHIKDCKIQFQLHSRFDDEIAEASWRETVEFCPNSENLRLVLSMKPHE